MNAPSHLPLGRVITILTLLIFLVSGAHVAAGQAGPQPANHAGLVVAFGDGRVETICVAFAEDEISGDELLSRAGLDPTLAPAGAVCAIDEVGCPADDCFCQCPELDNCLYWAYYNLEDGQWVYSQRGAAFSIVQDGFVDGWAWGKGDFDGAQAPPLLTFQQICPAQPPTPTPIPPTPVPPVAIPEPGTMTLAIGGLSLLAGFIGMRARRK